MIFSTSLICCDQADLLSDVKLLCDNGFTDFHADFMDGQFVPRLGICPEVIRDLRNSLDTKITIGSHLMLMRPMDFIDIIAPLSDIIWIHREIINPLRVVDYVHKRYPLVKIGFAYNPETPIDPAGNLNTMGIDSVLLMGINSGVLGTSKYPELIKLKSKSLTGDQSISVFLDGAVNKETIPQFKWLDGVVCGSSTIFKNVKIDENRSKDILSNLGKELG